MAINFLNSLEFLDPLKEVQVYELNYEKAKLLKIQFLCNPLLKDNKISKDLIEMSQSMGPHSNHPAFFKDMTMNTSFLEGKMVFEIELYKLMHWFYGVCIGNDSIKYSTGRPCITIPHGTVDSIQEEEISIYEDYDYYSSFSFLASISASPEKKDFEYYFKHTTRETFFKYFNRRRIIFYKVGDKEICSLVDTSYVDIDKKIQKLDEKLEIYSIVQNLSADWFYKRNQLTNLFLSRKIMLSEADRIAILKDPLIQTLTLNQIIKTSFELEKNSIVKCEKDLIPKSETDMGFQIELLWRKLEHEKKVRHLVTFFVLAVLIASWLLD